MQPLVYIVILNWNGLKESLACLDSISQMKYQNYKVVVVDNGSADGSVEEIHNKFPKIIIIKNEENLGFSGGCNIGIRHALNEQAESIWLLNNDTLVTENALLELCKFQYQEGCDLVGSELRNYPDGDWQGGGGNISFLRGVTYSVPCTCENVQSISGASVLIRTSVFEKIGLLDDRFFLYWEDVDFSFRARKAGCKLKLSCESVVYHMESASTSKISALKTYYITRNCIFFLKKHFPTTWIFLVWPFLARALLSAVKNRISLKVVVNSIRDGFMNNLGKKND